MRKYIKPAIVTVEIENQAILAASDPQQYSAQGGGTTDVVGANDLDLDWDEDE